jgi:AcrR family transcriptional regulator
VGSELPRNRYGGRSAEERRAERRERMLAAGLELYGTQGYAAATVERLCELAGLSTRQFYEEYDHRNQVLLDLYDEVNDRAAMAVTEVAMQALGDGLDFDVQELIRRSLAAYLKVTVDDQRWAQVVYVTIVGVSPQIEQHRRERRHAWAVMLSQLAEAGAERGRIPRRDFHLTMTAFVGAVHGLVLDWCQSDPRPPLDDVTETLTHLLFSALTAPASRT